MQGGCVSRNYPFLFCLVKISLRDTIYIFSFHPLLEGRNAF